MTGHQHYTKPLHYPSLQVPVIHPYISQHVTKYPFKIYFYNIKTTDNTEDVNIRDEKNIYLIIFQNTVFINFISDTHERTYIIILYNSFSSHKI